MNDYYGIDENFRLVRYYSLVKAHHVVFTLPLWQRVKIAIKSAYNIVKG